MWHSKTAHYDRTAHDVHFSRAVLYSINMYVSGLKITQIKMYVDVSVDVGAIW